MRPPKPHLQDPRNYIRAIEASKPYLEARSQEPNNRTLAIGKTATRIVENKLAWSEHLDIHTQAIHVIGKLGPFVEANRQLDNLRLRKESGEWVDKAEKNQFLDEVTEYNHVLHGLIDSNPQLTPGQLLDFVAKAQLTISSVEDAKYAVARTREVITGMKQEIAVESALYQIEGVEDIERGSVEEDRRGIDLKCTFYGEPLKIDAKSSQRGVDSAVARARSNGYEPDKLVTWSGINSSEFGESFRPSDEQLERISAKLESDIRNYIHRGSNQRALHSVG